MHQKVSIKSKNLHTLRPKNMATLKNIAFTLSAITTAKKIIIVKNDVNRFVNIQPSFKMINNSTRVITFNNISIS